MRGNRQSSQVPQKDFKEKHSNEKQLHFNIEASTWAEALLLIQEGQLLKKGKRGSSHWRLSD